MEVQNRFTRIPVSSLLNYENVEPWHMPLPLQLPMPRSCYPVFPVDQSLRLSESNDCVVKTSSLASHWNANQKADTQEEEKAENSGLHGNRRRWTKEEDDFVLSQVAKQGARRWDKIAEKLSGRNAQHVRLRYVNYLRFDSNRSRPFTNEEDRLILEMGTCGNRRWSKLAEKLERSHSSVKNRFQLLCRRASTTSS